MTRINKELIKGSSEILVLTVLRDESLYGYEIAKRIKTLSKDIFSMGEGTLYPLLHKMEETQLLESFWEGASGRKRKYYTLTRKGRKILAEKTAEWKTFSSAISDVIA